MFLSKEQAKAHVGWRCATGGFAPSGGTCIPGTELHLSAQAAPGYRFLSWEDGCTEALRVLKAEKSDTLTAFFVREMQKV